MLARKYRNQFYGTLCANMICVAYGTVCGWPAASFPELLSPETSPLPIGALDIEKLSWVVSYMCIGAFFGNSFYNWASDRFGRKNALIQSALPCLLGWCLLMFAQNAYYLYVARFLLGFSGAGAIVVIPMYVAEIADNDIRGSLGSLMAFSCNLGVLISFIIGHYFQYAMRPVVLLAFPIAFLLLFVNFPETPVFLMRHGRDAEAEKSLRFYRNAVADAGDLDGRPDADAAGPMLKVEMEEMRRTQMPADEGSDEKTNAEKANAIPWSEFNTRHGRRAAQIGIVLILASQFCGSFVMLNYTAEIFNQAGATMSSNVAAIVMGAIQLVGTYISTVLVDRAGRKFLLIVSAIGSALGLLVMATFLRCQESGYDVSGVAWLPMAAFAMSVFMANWGLMPLSFLVVAEVMPERLRSTGTSLCMTLMYAMGFVLLKGFPLMLALLGMTGSLCVFASSSLATAAYVWVRVPETRGKSFEEIQRLMEQ